MPKKYETNPLDQEVLQRAEKNRAFAQTDEMPKVQTAVFEAETRPFAPASVTEMQTERLPHNSDKSNINDSYNSVFNRTQSFSSEANPATVPVSVAAQKLILPPTSRKVLGLGMPENVAMMLPYLPWIVGAIIAVIVLFYVPKTETRVRFHAAQALALHLASWVIGAILASLAGYLPLADLIAKIFTVTVTLYFIVSLIRVWRGKPNHIEILDDVTDFLNEKIKPKS